MSDTDKKAVLEILFYVVLFVVLLGTGVTTLRSISGLVFAILAFLGVIFLIKQWKGL